MTPQQIKANAPEWADHYMILFRKVKYLQKNKESNTHDKGRAVCI